MQAHQTNDMGFTKGMYQIDFIIVKRNWKCSDKGSCFYHSSDKVMVAVVLHTKPPKYTKKTPHAFDVSKLMYNTNIKKTFEIAKGGGFEPLMELNNMKISELYDKFKTTTNEITEGLVGLRRNLRSEGFSPKTEFCFAKNKEKLD